MTDQDDLGKENDKSKSLENTPNKQGTSFRDLLCETFPVHQTENRTDSKSQHGERDNNIDYMVPRFKIKHTCKKKLKSNTHSGYHEDSNITNRHIIVSTY